MHPRNVSKQRQLQSAAIQELAKKRAQQLAAKSNQPSVEQDDHASRQPSDRFNMSDMSNALPHASNDDDLRTLLTTVATTPLPDDDGGANDNVGGQPANSSTADQPKKPSTNASDLVVGPFYLEGSVAGTLYSHQHEGVRWLCSLHALKKGGILAVSCLAPVLLFLFQMAINLYCPHRMTWDWARCADSIAYMNMYIHCIHHLTHADHAVCSIPARLVRLEAHAVLSVCRWGYPKHIVHTWTYTILGERL